MKKLILLCLTLILTISFVISGVTLAFFTDQESVSHSVFKMGRLSLTSVNTFSAFDDDPFTFEKYPSWTVQNTGTLNLNLRVRVVCEWAQNIENVDANEGNHEIIREVMSEEVNETSSAVVKVIILNEEELIEKNSIDVNDVPLYVVSLNDERWTQDGDGWYIYRYPILPNEKIQVDAKIVVLDPVWQGSLKVNFEAEAQDILSRGDYD